MSFRRREMTCFAVMWTTSAPDENFFRGFLSAAPLGRSDHFNSRIVSKHFQAKRLGIIEEPDFKITESIQMTLILAVVEVVLA